MQGPVRVSVTASLAMGLVISLLVVTGSLSLVDLLFPGASGKGSHVLVEDFGADAIPERFSYDGQEVYVIARQFPDVARAHDDGIAEFRLRRIAQPAIASVAPPGNATVALLVLTNVVGVGLAAGALADIAARHGRDPRVGYAACLALAFPVVITTTEPFAFGLGFLGLALVLRHRLVPAIIAFAVAGLSRETALVMAVAAGICLFLEGSRRAAVIVPILSALPFAIWVLTLRSLVPADTYQSTALFGFLDRPEQTTIDIVACAVTIALMVFAVWRWRDVAVLWLTAAGFLAACAFYIGDQYQWHGLPRVSAAGVALGVAALGPRRVERAAVAA